MIPVVAYGPCRWCNETLPLDHDCSALDCHDRQPDGERCGRCRNDLLLQQSDPRYSESPSDLDHP
ncbi:hypothetical protein [Planobispora rosea]|uniref:hypothetical protein n=1 Tax=Planobispora rosea TaxID=35762 RepID=UPI00083AC0D6|nr:hypothetical protein [Planobispora rosea]